MRRTCASPRPFVTPRGGPALASCGPEIRDGARRVAGSPPGIGAAGRDTATGRAVTFAPSGDSDRMT